MIRTVIFDIDGTLYDYYSANDRAMDAIQNYACENFGWSEEQFRKAHKEAYDILYQKAEGTAASHSRMIRYGILAERAGLSEVHALNMDEIYWTAFIKDIVPFPDLPETITSLKEDGYRIGIGTNMTAYPQYLKLRRLGLLDLFDFVMTSEEALAEKPRKQFFLCCAEKAGCAPQECLFIGDEMEKDVQGALSAGMHARLFCPQDTGKEGMPDPSLLFRSYRDLPELVWKISETEA